MQVKFLQDSRGTIAERLWETKRHFSCLYCVSCVSLPGAKNSHNNQKQCPSDGGKPDLAPAVVFSMGMTLGAVVDCGNSANQHFFVDFLQAIVYFGFGQIRSPA